MYVCVCMCTSVTEHGHINYMRWYDEAVRDQRNDGPQKRRLAEQIAGSAPARISDPSRKNCGRSFRNLSLSEPKDQSTVVCSLN